MPQSASTSVQITITDVNDCTPTFEQASFTVFISENAEMGVCIHTLYVPMYIRMSVCGKCKRAARGHSMSIMDCHVRCGVVQYGILYEDAV